MWWKLPIDLFLKEKREITNDDLLIMNISNDLLKLDIFYETIYDIEQFSEI